MTRLDAPAFAAEMTLTAELFAAPLSDARITAYYQALEDVPWEDVRAALAAARQCERWFPTPAVLRELIEAPLELAAADAFAEVWLRAGGVGGGARDLDSPARSAVSAMGGWGTFTEAKTATGSMLSAQFRKLYIAYARQDRVIAAKQRALAPATQWALEPAGNGLDRERTGAGR